VTAVYVESGIDQGAIWHFGDPTREQRALEEGRAFVDLSHRPVVAIDGSARLSWLHSLSTQHLESLTPGEWTESLILDPRGRVEHQLHLVDDGETTWMHLEPGTSETLISFLDSMKFMLDVSIRDASAQMCVLRAPGTADGHGGPYALVARAEKDDVINAFLSGGAIAAGMWAYEAERVALGIPRWGFDTDEKTIPHEVGWIATAVHLKKGCYRGQETVAKVHNMGKPPRRLVLLHLDGSRVDLPAHGDAVMLEGDQVGWIGTVARHHQLGPVALAVVKRTVDADAVLHAADIAATQEVIVPID
jgi:folate-binding protein YgfZ